ncbi:MAG: putative oxidoreductase of aldo/keto reductase family [Deltaproteobacteria bacterium]|nr:putative oxidoreductase of aldo/keto reductase family [Deltaproteobacteria bacterium]MBP2686437.1 putative oxidoreductase of aldo/keto reductase family [Deltaproteobacteria bacterium]
MRPGKTRRDFLRMMGAAAGVAAGAALPGIPPNASAAASPSPGTLEKRPLGKTGFQVGTVGFGAMTTRDPEVIRFAVERGVDYIDTAARYMGGENERIVGRALAGIRDKVVLATKVKIGTVDEMILSAENSLRSLKVDVIDLLQLHNISTEAEVTDEGPREAFRKLIDQGKVRAAGVTTHSGQEAVLRAVAKHGFYKTVLVAYSFRSDTGVAATVKEALGMSQGLSNTIRTVAESGIGVIAMKTQAGGYASPPGGFSPHQAALAWVLANPGVATAIPGMTSYAQVEENLGARGKRFTLADRVALGRYALEIGDRHCGLCGACGGVCPSGVEVPNVLRALTYLEGYREEGLARSAYGSLPPGRNAAACGECEACLVACRLRLPVGRLARRAHARLAG